jgi:hypothetical protein
MRRGLRWVLVAGVLGLVLGAASCGDDGDSAGPTTTSTTAAPADDAGEDDEPADDEDEPTVPGGATVPTADVGDCISNAITDQGVTGFEVVPCDEPHAAELFHKFDLPDGEFPTEEAASVAIEDECLGATFEDYVGTPYADSEIFLTPVTPTPETWEQADDREVLCFGGLQGGAELTESIEGSGR